MPEFPTLLSVVIPTWNAAKLTAKTLEALVYDGVPAWAEVIVVDDGSDDGTAGRISRRFPGIRVLRHEHNRGF
jgi:glycosyltransferase involved in cell wall biosynthesis